MSVDTPLPLALFDYELPPDLIAQHPAEPRDASRLMHVAREGGVSHRTFTDLSHLLEPGDVLVVNRTRVVPARVWAAKPTGGKVELLFFRPHEDGGPLENATRWWALGKPGKALQPGKEVRLPDGSTVRVVERKDDAALLEATEPMLEVMGRVGEIPLPPYIERSEGPTSNDAEDYQTVFAKEAGAVAAPTASLHFTPRVMKALEKRGVQVTEVLLHVGPGTFLPVRKECADDVRAHQMHAEFYEVPQAARQAVEDAQGAVVAVGTTAVRALETWKATGQARGESELFIYPGFEFQVVDKLITNFHLPRSTLLMLVSAFVGRDRVLDAYAEAVREKYRFFSYGDAMLLERV